MTSRIGVKKDVLLWAISRAGLTADSLQEKFPRIHAWISGDNKPTLRQLESLAKETLTPLGYLFLGEPPEDKLRIPHFRTDGRTSHQKPSPSLLKTIRTMYRRQAWMRDLLLDQRVEPLQFVDTAKLGVEPETLARRMRDTLGLELDWASRQPTWTDALKTLRNAVEKAGVIVVFNGIVGNNTHRKLDPSEFRGFVLVDKYAPLVFVNSADAKAAQMFTLAHELAHLFYGSSAAFDLRRLQPAREPIEQACNQAAAEFLVPSEQLLEYWPSIANSQEPFQKIARRFKVSSLVAARRALDLSLIDIPAFLEFYNNYLQDDRRKSAKASDGGDFYKTQNLRVGKFFAASVIRAVKQGKLLYSEAYQLTDLHGETFDRYAATLESEAQ